MLRRALIVLLIVSVTALSHQPALALMLPAPAAAAMPGDAAANHDEPAMRRAATDAMPCANMAGQDPAGTDLAGTDLEYDHDCCSDIGKTQKPCPDADACAARCHVNGALEPAWFEHRAGETLAFLVVPQEMRMLVPVSCMTLFRPPIL